TKAGEGGVGCEGSSVLAEAAYESVMATAAELSRPTVGDRSLERSCSPNLSQEVVCEVFRSLHTLAGQLNIRDDVVKITIDWNKLQSLSAFQPALLFSALEQHVLYLQGYQNIIHLKLRIYLNLYSSKFSLENSCARTDAVFTPYPGFKSHVKVSRVVNTYGPQTRPEGIQGSGHKPNSMLRDCGNQAVEERLQNIEAHLRLQTGGPVPRDIYQRIKKLEDRILELEGISPEYFQSVFSDE
ncbi:MAP3K12-binding inhibitory protein 1, partial [Eschrichtius robustus]|nr:MAP3K12-binding inhibitory protein 1 [Eschrichtius robustus]